jgi:hypothetical protein
MKKQDKIIAIGGVALIIVLAIVAVVLLLNIDDGDSSIVKVKPQVTEVDLKEEMITPAAIKVESDPDNEEPATVTAAVTETVVDETKTPENEFYVKAGCKEIRNNDNQMAELFGYWDDYHLEAVGDLIRLERVRMLTKELSGSGEYYYYGETDANNVPNGKGLAIYENDTYYFGEWNKGLRSGSGMWLRIYPDTKTAKVGSYTGVMEHMYNGQFKNDLPNGNGQEHYTYQTDQITGELTIANVVGSFKNGYYDGELYIMTIDNKGVSYDWFATGLSGCFKPCVENKVSTTNKKPVWKKGDDNDHSTDENDDGFHWMTDKENANWGIYSLKKPK